MKSDIRCLNVIHVLTTFREREWFLSYYDSGPCFYFMIIGEIFRSPSIKVLKRLVNF